MTCIVGIGATMIPHCDFAYASSTAYFWTPFTRIAVVPEFASSVLFPQIMVRSTLTWDLKGAGAVAGLRDAAYGEANGRGNCESLWLHFRCFPPRTLTLRGMHAIMSCITHLGYGTSPCDAGSYTLRAQH